MLFFKSVLAPSLAVVALAAPVTQPRQAGGLVAGLESTVSDILNDVDVTLSGSAGRRQVDVNVGLVPILESDIDGLLNGVDGDLSGLELA